MEETQYLLPFQAQVVEPVHPHTQQRVIVEVPEVEVALLTQLVAQVYMVKVSKVEMHHQQTKVVVIQVQAEEEVQVVLVHI